MKSVIALSAMAIALASAGSITFCDSEPCGTGSCSTQSPGGNLDCRELGGIKSAQVNSVDDGCSCELLLSPCI